MELGRAGMKETPEGELLATVAVEGLANTTTSRPTQHKEVGPSSSAPVPPLVDHPVLKVVLDIGTQYIIMESECNHLRTHLERTKEEMADTVRRIGELERELESERKANLELETAKKRVEGDPEKATADARVREHELRKGFDERTGLQAVRFRSVADFMLGALGIASTSSSHTNEDALIGVVDAVEGISEKAKAIMGKASSALTVIHEGVFPKEDPPKDLGALVDVFDLEGAALAGFARAHTVHGSEATWLMLLGHGIQGALTR